MALGTSWRRAAGTLVEVLGATALALFVAVRFRAPAAWIVVPLVLAAVHRRSLGDYGLDLRLGPPRLRTQLALGVAAAALYALGHALVEGWLLGRSFSPRLPGDLPSRLGGELLSVALPEEFFFRGWMQRELDRALPRRHAFFGARVGAGFWLQAGIFAACHLHSGDWTQLRVFFFALLAGWLRERSGSIVAPSLWHACANVWYRLVAASFR